MGARFDWKVQDADWPENIKPDEKLGFAVKHALLASSGICWPSWEYSIVHGAVELEAKSDPSFEAADLEGRETVIGCGVSLQLFKLTLKHLGCLGHVELFPDLERPMLAARIHVGRSGERDAFEGSLFAAITQDDPASANGLLASEAAMASLEHAAEQERAWLQFAKKETSWARLHTLALGPRRFEVEVTHPPNEVPPQLAVNVRTPSPVGDDPHESRAGSVLSGTFAVLKTKTDDRYGWLAAGQALARLILLARVSGISCALHTEPLRSARVRASLRTEIGRKGFAQAILRFGTAWPSTLVQPRIESQPLPARLDLAPPMRT
jgi:hypothetical protein